MTKLEPALIRLALVLTLGSIASGLDTTIVNVALDAIGRELVAGVASLQWVSTIYLLAAAIVIPLTAWTTDRFGARRMWFLALGVFLLGSIACGLAWSLPSLIVFRGIQGLGGGMLLPLVRTILAQAAGRDKMGRAMVFVGIPSSLTPAIGPVLGGFIVHALTWRWAFYVNVPICLLAMACAWRVLPPDGKSRGTQALDGLGLALLTVGLGAVVFALSQLGLRPESFDLPPAAALGIGVLSLAAYVWHALRLGRRAIIDMKLFAVRAFAASVAVLFLVGGSLFGLLFLLPLFYQRMLLTGSFDAGLLLAPVGLGIALSMAFAGKIVDRTKAERVVMLTGLGLGTIGISAYVFLAEKLTAWLIAAANLSIGLGLGAVFIATFTATYRELAKEQFAAATSASRIIQQLGSLLGIAFLAFVLQGHGAVSAASFHRAFAWAMAFTMLAAIPAACGVARRTHEAFGG